MITKRTQYLAVALGCLVVVGTVMLRFTISGYGASQAVRTTDSGGVAVNQNLYASKYDVYVNGGPDKNRCAPIGFSDGDYYFQVTDPDGKTLLSTDGLEQRKFTVRNGFISAYLGTRHATGSGPCNDKTIALAPFSDTPNNGGEYKVWVTAVSKYAAGQGKFGFREKDSVTDQFKVSGGGEPGGTITGRVYSDVNANGVLDFGEAGMPGIVVNVTDSGTSTLLATTATGADGSYLLIGVPVGEVDLCEVAPPLPELYEVTEPAGSNGCAHLTVVDGSMLVQDFGNKRLRVGKR